MFTVVTVALLCALLAWVLIMFFKKSEPVPVKPQQDLANLRIGDARTGDTLSIAGVGDDLSDLDFTVDRRKQYEATRKQWFELSGPYRERRVYLEVFDNDDETEVRGAFSGEKLTLDQLGLTEQDLAEMDERQNPADSFEFDGAVWMYRASREVGEFRDGQDTGTGFYRWDFQEENGPRFLYVRKPEAEPFGGSVLTRLNPADITVYRGG